SIPVSFIAHTSPYTKEPCEVWTTVWLDDHCVLSGGEDSTLKLWDLRMHDKKPAAVNQTHQCGIVSLHVENDSTSNRIISGSYDEHLRRIDIRNFTQPVLSKKVNFSIIETPQKKFCSEVAISLVK
ncbi:unnamed protein product, partial [Gongylonema pulchrum]|uniref:methylated diphthine methylhydrolase n=1 Tax=Gongylonema pulchrum TaxID=637853 RepID=A0A183DH57_9BILA